MISNRLCTVMLSGSSSDSGFRFAAIGNPPDFLSTRRQHPQGGFRQQKTRLGLVAGAAVFLNHTAGLVGVNQPPLRTAHLYRAGTARKPPGIACFAHNGIIT